jgi:putative transposase
LKQVTIGIILVIVTDGFTRDYKEESMVESKINVLGWLRKQVESADQDLLREMVKVFAESLMSAEADSICGADYGSRSPERTNSRNGYRERDWDTRAGTMALNIPKLRRGSYFPDWLLENRRRAERALVQVVAESYVRGVSTRRVDGLVQALGVSGISKSQVSEMAKALDAEVEDFRQRPLMTGPFRYLWVDAITQRCREGGRVVNVAAVTASAVNAEGKRELLGLDVFTSEDEAAWTQFLRSLSRRGLSGLWLIVSDAHPGLKAAIAKVFPGAAWQRCRAHFMRNLLSRVPKKAQDFVATLARSIFAQPDREEVCAQHRRVVDQLRGRFPQAADMLEEAAEDLLAFTACPKPHWRQIWSNNPQERLNREIRRRTDVAAIFPNREAIIRLVGAVLAEYNDEWAVARRYMSLETLATREQTMATAQQIAA